MKDSTSRDLKEELELLKAAAEMAFDDRHNVDFYLEQLREKVESKKHHLEELYSEWYDHFIDFHANLVYRFGSKFVLTSLKELCI